MNIKSAFACSMLAAFGVAQSLSPEYIPTAITDAVAYYGETEEQYQKELQLFVNRIYA